MHEIPDVLHLSGGQRSPQPTQLLSVLQDCTQLTAKPWHQGTNTKWNCFCSNGPGLNSIALKMHQFRAINEVFKTPSELGFMECDPVEELRSPSGVRLESNIICDARLPPTPGTCVPPKEISRNKSHGTVRSDHSLQSTKRVHPQPCLTVCQEHRKVWELT